MLGVALAAADLAPAEAPLARFAVTGDAIDAPLDGLVGDAARGRRIIANRDVGNCFACHRAPEPLERFQGNLGPDLAGVARRLTRGQIRLRLVDASLVNPRTIMPPYHRVSSLTRVAPSLRGRPILTAQEIEDVIAYLSTLD
ncbi:MAG TPA: sulfur oxidation c-type cytochrome SoxX [Hyphomicrobiaceae bacterium]|nr:sulfur oxidation c-type cytochrome SoxX [Hyphomicrobiaceae bacterium]